MYGPGTLTIRVFVSGTKLNTLVWNTIVKFFGIIKLQWKREKIIKYMKTKKVKNNIENPDDSKENKNKRIKMKKILIYILTNF